MAWKKKDYAPTRDCVICGEPFERAQRGWCAITCSDECAHARHLRRGNAYRREHLDENRDAVARYAERNRDQVNAKRRERYDPVRRRQEYLESKTANDGAPI